MKWKRILLKSFVFFSFFICILFTFIYFYISLSPKMDLKKTNNIIIYDKDDNVIYKGNGSKEWISLKLIDKDLINATISIEDKRFYKHNGFDYVRILKSMYKNAKNGSIVEGASTISQQYARNLYLNFDRNWNRKFKEAWLALKLEINYSKDEILEGYLNTILINLQRIYLLLKVLCSQVFQVHHKNIHLLIMKLKLRKDKGLYLILWLLMVILQRKKQTLLIMLN